MNEFIKSFDGMKLFTNFEKVDNAKAAVVIVHGLAEHQGRYDYLADKFHEEGISTYRFDHRGHGKSEGDRGYFNDFNELIDDVYEVVKIALDENKDIPVYLLGHSMGGYAVSLFAAKYPDLNIGGLITSGAVTHDEAGVFKSVPAGLDLHFKLANELGPGVCSVEEVRTDYANDPLNLTSFTAGLVYSLSEGLDWYKENVSNIKYNTLILHGYEDPIVSFKDSVNNFNALTGKDVSIKLYKNCFHEILNEWKKDEIISDIINWIEYRV